MASCLMRTSSKICCLYRLHAGTTLKATLISRQQSAVAFIHRNFSQSRTVSQVQKEKSEEASSDLDVRREKPYEHLSFSQKVVEAGTDFSYLLVIAAGVGVTGILLYTLGSELFSKSGPNSVYNSAVKKCMKSTQVCDCLGAPISAYGEGRRRRQHVQHVEFVTDTGEKHTRIQFHLKGQFRTAIVHAETFINEEGSREFEYLIVACEGYPPRTIQLEKREKKPSTPETVTFY